MENIESVVHQLSDKGIAIYLPLKTGLDNNRQAWIQDPDGNRIELPRLESSCFHGDLRMRFGVWTLKLKEGEGQSMALHEPRLQTAEDPARLTGIYKVIKRFNRNTTWVATGLLGSVVFAALMVAVKERHAKADDLTKEARQTTGNLLLDANPAATSAAMVSNEKSTGNITSGQATSVDRKLTPELSHPDVQANATSWSPANRKDYGRVKGLKVPRARSRSSGQLRFVDVKMRLIVLWHQSLAQSEKSRTWTAFSNSNKGERRKVGYTAETYH